MFSSAQLIQASLILSQFLYALRIPQPIENCVLVTGATGYIGRSVVRELVDRKIPTVAVVRSNDISERSKQYLKGSTVVVSNVCDSSDLIRVYNTFSPTATICCLASRSGVKRDTWAIDYEASLNCLRAQESVLSKNQFSNNLNHFVLLSAYCVGKPLLQFHYAKLKLEAAIRASSLVSHSIVRPTAFFKSVDGQFESVTKGFPTLYFGGGSVRANPISEKDLAEYLVTCATNPQQLNLLNRTIDIGGPDQPLSKFQQLQLIYDTLNIPTSKRRSIPIPMEVLDTIINSFQFLEKVCGNFGMEKYSLQCQDAAEIARIVRYYAQEDMVTTEEEQKYGRILVMLFLEHLLLGLKIVLGNVIDDIPPEVREEMAKRLAEKTESNIGKTVELFTHQTKSMAYDKLAHTAEKDPNADSIPLKNAVLLVDKKIKTDLMIADQVATSNISSAPKPTAAKDKGNNGKQSTNETKELDATSQLKALFERDAIGFHPIILLSIVFLPYLCAYYNFPLLLYIPIALLVLTYIQSQKDRADRQFAVGVVTDANLLKLIGQEMPSWFHDSEFQRVEWLNFVLSKLFPQIAHAVEAIVKEKVQPSIDENTPFYLPRLEIVHANLGSVSPKITGVRVFHNRESSIRLDLELKWSSDLQVTLKLNTTPLPINVELTDLRVTANVRVELLELTNRLPCFRALSITCMKKPKIDFSLKIASLDIMNMGAGSDYNITSLVQTIIDSVLAGVCLYPKKIMVPMDDKVDLDDLANETPDGILLVRLIRGEQLLAVNYTGNSDPYVEFVSSHDPSHIQRSTVKYSTIKPVWHEDFTFFVHDKNTETITVSVYDSDITNQMPTFMGNAVIHLDLIKRNHKTPQEFNLVLSDVSTGILRVSCAYRSINKKKSTANLHKMNERGEIIEDHVLYTDIDDKELEDNTALIGEDSEYDDVRPYEEGRDTLTEMPSFNSPNNRASKRGKSIDDNSSDVSSIRGRRLSNTFSSLQNAQQKMEDYHKSLEQMVGVLNISQIKLKDIKLPDGFLTSTTLRLYVTFTIGNKILKTKYIKNSQDPTFIETFAFLINSLNEEMVVNVYNKVKYTMSMTPKPIASVKIALKTFAKNDDDFASGDGKNRRASVIQKVEQDYPLNGLKDEGYVSFKAVLSLFD